MQTNTTFYNGNLCCSIQQPLATYSSALEIQAVQMTNSILKLNFKNPHMDTINDSSIRCTLMTT